MTKRESALFRVTQLGERLDLVAESAQRRLAALDRTQHGSMALELSEVLGLLSALNAEGRMKDLLESIVDSALQLTDAERGYIVLLEGDDLKPAASRSRSGRRVRTPLGRISTSITHEVAATGRSLLVTDALDDDRYSGLMSVARNRIRSLACVPLKTDLERLGALYLDAGERRAAFMREQLPLIEAYADLAALAIRNLRRSKNLEHERKKLQSDLHTQRSVVMAYRRSDEQLRRAGGLGDERGRSAAMQEVQELVRKAAAGQTSVLITGESGVGKELIAQDLHRQSARHQRPLIRVNCASLPENLLESELFGHKRGAFTGADADHQGLFALADEGILFLDEIGELPLAAQAKLLRVLEDGRLRPLGAEEDCAVDVRIVAATNRNLRQMVAAGSFREDLFYRLCVVEIEVPPLRERKGDVAILARHFLSQIARKKSLSERALRTLERYDWPGNVRQLKNEVDRAALVSDVERLDVGDFSPEIITPQAASSSLLDADGHAIPLKDAERELIRLALSQTGNDRKAAARVLGISRSTLYEKIKKLSASQP